MFGGDQVVGVDDYGPQCPGLTDPIVIRNSDGSAIDTGVISSLLDDRRGLALAFLQPALGVALALLAIWGLKRLVVYAWGGLRDLYSRQ